MGNKEIKMMQRRVYSIRACVCEVAVRLPRYLARYILAESGVVLLALSQRHDVVPPEPSRDWEIRH